MIVLGTCNASPVDCSEHLLMYKKNYLILAKYLLYIDI
jgi:hypothetical protein